MPIQCSSFDNNLPVLPVTILLAFEAIVIVEYSFSERLVHVVDFYEFCVQDFVMMPVLFIINLSD